MKILASALAEFLGVRLVGPNVEVNKVCSLKQLQKNSLAFIDNPLYSEEPNVGAFVIVSTSKNTMQPDNAYVAVSNPRKAYADIVRKFFCSPRELGVCESAHISKQAVLGEGCYVGHNVVIEDNVIIGNRCTIQANAVLKSGVQLGDDCFISPGVVIGGEGFGVVSDNDSSQMMPHIASVKIGHSVFIGANTTVQRGTIEDTIVGDNVKLSQNVSIGHNCILECGVNVAGSAHLSGSVRVGQGTFIGAGAVVMDGVKIGGGAKLGLGCVIQSNVSERSIMMMTGTEKLDLLL